mgnify:CR=1 FL=1
MTIPFRDKVFEAMGSETLSARDIVNAMYPDALNCDSDRFKHSVDKALQYLCKWDLVEFVGYRDNPPHQPIKLWRRKE